MLGRSLESVVARWVAAFAARDAAPSQDSQQTAIRKEGGLLFANSAIFAPLNPDFAGVGEVTYPPNLYTQNQTQSGGLASGYSSCSKRRNFEGRGGFRVPGR